MIKELIIMYPALLLSITIHECAHAWMANKLGDPTAKYEGRISFNPMVHIDPIGTLWLPLLLFIFRAPILFGWAKPVPVNLYNLSSPRKDNLWISLAGPLSNLIMFVSLTFIFHFILFVFKILYLASFVNIINFLLSFISTAGVINITLAIFNMIPLRPLDGSGVLLGLLPSEYAYKYQQLPSHINFFILMLLFALGIFEIIFREIITFLGNIIYFKPLIYFFFKNI